MRDKMKKAFTVLLATAFVSAAFAGCGEGTLDYKGDSLDGYVSSAAVSSNGGFAVEKGDYVYFINGQGEQDAENEYGEVVEGALMRISKAKLAEGDYSDVKTVVPSLFVAKDYSAGIFIYGDYVYYATPTTDKMDSGEAASSYIDFKKAKLDGSEGPMKDYFLRLSESGSKYRFVQENGVVYCMYEEDGALKSVNTETKEISTLVSGASTFYFDTENLENPNVYYTMSVKAEIDSSAESYNQIYRVNAGATAKVDEENAKYTVYDAKGNAVKTYAFNKADMEEANEEAEENDVDKEDLPYDFEDYTTYPYVNLGTLVLDGVGGGDYIPQTQYNWESDRTLCGEYDGYSYTLSAGCYQDGALYFTRSSVGAKTDSDAVDTKLYYLEDGATTAEGWSVIGGNATLADSVVSQNATTASTSTSIFYKVGNKHYYMYVANSNLYKAGYDNDADTAIAAVRMAESVGTPTLWKIDEETKFLYFYAASGNGNNLSRIKYDDTGVKDAYNALYKDEAGYEDFQVVSLDYLVWNNDWYKPEIIGDTVLYSNAQSFGTSTYNYVYATKMGSAANIKTANDNYKKVQDKIAEYSSYSDLQNVMTYYYRTGELSLYEEVIDEYSASMQEKVTEFTALFAEGGELQGLLESSLLKQVGKLSEEDAEAIAESWKGTLKQVVVEEEEEEGLPTWAIWLISCGSAVIVLAAAVIVVRKIKRRKARKAEAEATVNAYKRKKIDTTDDKSIDVYADDEDEAIVESVEAPDTVEESYETAEETAEEAPVEEAETVAEAPVEAPVETESESNE